MIQPKNKKGSFSYDSETKTIHVNRYGVDYSVPYPCLTHNVMYELSEFFGSGITSSVFTIKTFDNKEWVLRMTPLEVPIAGPDCDLEIAEPDECVIITKDKFIEQAQITQKLGDAGIAPYVLDWWLCEDERTHNKYQKHLDLGFIVSEKYDMSLRYFIDHYPQSYVTQYEEIVNQLDTIVNRMLDNFKLCHGDLHTDNIIVKISGPDHHVDGIRLIDFDNVTPCESKWVWSELQKGLAYDFEEAVDET